MRTPEEVLAQLGIDEHHAGPYSYAELRAAVAKTLELENNYRENVMRAVRTRAAPEPALYSPEWVAQEKAKSTACLMEPARITEYRNDAGFAGYDSNDELPRF